MKTQLFYDPKTHSIFIDEKNKSTKIELSREIDITDALYAIASPTVKEIVNQLTDGR